MLKSLFKREKMSADNTIYYISHEDIKNKNIVYDHIYTDKDTNYYFSDDFSKEFYIDLASLGFISTSTYYNQTLYLLPELQFEYAILDFDDLHISKNVKKLLKKENYQFSSTKNVDRVLKKLDDYHNPNWLIEEYMDLIKELAKYKDPNNSFELKCFQIEDKDTKEIIAAEIGYRINNIYTSLTGFSSKEKKYNHYGKLQLVLLALYLKKNSYSFWNLGHPYMQYKFDLGAKVYSREEFLKRWHS